MESTTPLLNEYKLDFFWKRFPQTILGGIKLKLGFPAPAYIYIGQIVVFLIPWLFGGLFTIASEFGALNSTVAACVCGGSITLFVLVAQIISVVLDRRKNTVTGLTHNLLSDENEVEFDGCCTAETYLFIIPRKKYLANVAIHAAIAGVMCGYGVLYLLPGTLNTLYGSSTAATVIIFILGWTVMCIAQYPLTTGAPPEPATFRTSDVYEMMALMRPFYVLLCLSIDLVFRFEPSLLVANQVLHVVFVLLPVFWTAGMLPPMDTFFLWATEQILVHGYGGSPMSSDLRLVLMMLVSTALFIAALFIQSTITVVVLCAAIGYILSTDVGHLGSQLLGICMKNSVSKTKPNKGFLWKWDALAALYHFSMLLIVSGLAFVIQYFSTSIPSDLASYIGYAVFAILVVEHQSARFQPVYMLFGFFRSRLYPPSVSRTTVFRKGKKILAVFGWIRRACISFVGPLMMLTYLCTAITSLDHPITGSTIVNSTNATNFISNDFLIVLGSVRAFRWIWQDTSHALLEMSVVHLRGVVYPDDPFTSSLHISVFLLLVGFCRDRFYQLYNKLYFYIVVLITSYSEKKQRRKTSAGLIAISCLLLPLVLAVIITSVVISAPLIPLFTLPVMLIGFARHERFWPGSVGGSANTCADSVFYSHLMPSLCKALKKMFAFGSLGTADPGNHFLARFQDRMVWINILERGHAFCTLSVKGLEMQETSCHTVEAARIDDMFEQAFENENAACCKINPYPLNVLTPMDAVEIETYSDAKNVLTGIIDSPENLEILNKSFIKCLVWVLLQHTCDVKTKRVGSGISLSSPSRARSMASVKSPMTNHTASTMLSVPGTVNPLVHPVEAGDNWATDSIASNSRPTTAKSRLSRRSSLGDWSDDNESLALEPITNTGKPRINLLAGLNSRAGTVDSDYKTHRSDVGSKRTPVTKLGIAAMDQWDDTDDLLNELDEYGLSAGDNNRKKIPKETLDFGLPAMDIKQEKAALANNVKTQNMHQAKSRNMFKPVTNLAGSMQFSSPYSSRLSLPLKWREIPIEQMQLNSILSQFPREWFCHVLSTLDLSLNGRPSSVIASEISSDEVLVGIYAQITMACYAIVNVLGLHGSDAVSMGPSHVYKVYCGDIPWSLSSEWLTEDPELMQIVLKAYRYAVKMMIDQAIMGEASDNDEVQEYLDDYDQNMYVGLQTDQQWQEAITSNKPNLFALGSDPIAGTYTSRVLTLVELPLMIGRLNKEAVHSQWANLNLELLYFTNDDDERYSIQAHPTILRNLTVQAADPPLGYPIFASEPISIPIL